MATPQLGGQGLAGTTLTYNEVDNCALVLVAALHGHSHAKLQAPPTSWVA